MSRTPESNRFAVDPLGVGDQISVAISQFLSEGTSTGLSIKQGRKGSALLPGLDAIPQRMPGNWPSSPPAPYEGCRKAKTG